MFLQLMSLRRSRGNLNKRHSKWEEKKGAVHEERLIEPMLVNGAVVRRRGKIRLFDIS